jgi:hypothetical protein
MSDVVELMQFWPVDAEENIGFVAADSDFQLWLLDGIGITFDDISYSVVDGPDESGIYELVLDYEDYTTLSELYDSYLGDDGYSSETDNSALKSYGELIGKHEGKTPHGVFVKSNGDIIMFVSKESISHSSEKEAIEEGLAYFSKSNPGAKFIKFDSEGVVCGSCDRPATHSNESGTMNRCDFCRPVLGCDLKLHAEGSLPLTIVEPQLLSLQRDVNELVQQGASIDEIMAAQKRLDDFAQQHNITWSRHSGLRVDSEEDAYTFAYGEGYGHGKYREPYTPVPWDKTNKHHSPNHLRAFRNVLKQSEEGESAPVAPQKEFGEPVNWIPFDDRNKKRAETFSADYDEHGFRVCQECSRKLLDEEVVPFKSMTLCRPCIMGLPAEWKTFGAEGSNPSGGATGDQIIAWEHNGLSSPSGPPSDIMWAETFEAHSLNRFNKSNTRPHLGSTRQKLKKEMFSEVPSSLKNLGVLSIAGIAGYLIAGRK